MEAIVELWQPLESDAIELLNDVLCTSSQVPFYLVQEDLVHDALEVELVPQDSFIRRIAEDDSEKLFG